MKTILSTITAAFALGASLLFAAAAEPKAVLGAYEKVSQALVNDDLAGAKTAAAGLKTQAGDSKALARHADQLAQSDSLKSAREHFKAISQEAVKLAEGKPGYFVMTCPMAKADWVQTDKKIANPYMGQGMPGCGSIKGKSGAMRSSGGGCCMMAS